MKTLILTLLFTALSLPALAAERKKVSYEIPAPDSLAAYSTFEIEYETRQHSDGTTEIRYRMPATLLGKTQEFRFRGRADRSASSFTLSSENGEMNCVKLPGRTPCNVLHKDVSVDLGLVKEALDLLPISEDEKRGRLDLATFVSRREGGDMVGVLTYVPGLDY